MLQCNPNHASLTSSGYGEIPGSMSGVFLGHGRPKTSRVTAVTANVDMPPSRQLNVALIEEKSSFIIGSPPSSSDGGSIGSDHSALIQRALESGGPINLETGSSTYRHLGTRHQSQGIWKYRQDSEVGRDNFFEILFHKYDPA